jgi:hypothetical protein
MEMRQFGRTGMRLSVLGFGCDAVGGLMVRGNPLDQERATPRKCLPYPQVTLSNAARSPSLFTVGQSGFNTFQCAAESWRCQSLGFTNRATD